MRLLLQTVTWEYNNLGMFVCRGAGARSCGPLIRAVWRWHVYYWRREQTPTSRDRSAEPFHILCTSIYCTLETLFEVWVEMWPCMRFHLKVWVFSAVCNWFVSVPVVQCLPHHMGGRKRPCRDRSAAASAWSQSQLLWQGALSLPSQGTLSFH